MNFHLLIFKLWKLNNLGLIENWKLLTENYVFKFFFIHSQVCIMPSSKVILGSQPIACFIFSGSISLLLAVVVFICFILYENGRLSPYRLHSNFARVRISVESLGPMLKSSFSTF